MKGTLTFDLPGESEDFLRAVLADNLASSLHKTQQMLIRMKNADETPVIVQEFLDDVLFPEFQNILVAEGIDLDQIWT